MIALHENYVVDATGHKVAVVLPVAEFESLLARLKELEVEDEAELPGLARMYAEAMTEPQEYILWEQAKAELEAAWAKDKA